MADTNVFQLSQPGYFADPLTEVLRKGARPLLAQAVEAEVAALLSRYADETLALKGRSVPPRNARYDARAREVALRHSSCEADEQKAGADPLSSRSQSGGAASIPTRHGCSFSKNDRT